MIDTADLRKTLASNILRLRRDRGMSQQALADRIGISRVQLNRIENGRASPSAELLFSLADALSVATDSLRQIPLD